MFTGIVQGLGVLRRLRSGDVEIAFPDAFRGHLEPGSSVAVNGVCLTVRELTADSFGADLSSETFNRTSFSSLYPDVRVNLESAVSPSGALDGHLVLGHVDAVGRIRAWYRERDSWTLIVSYPADYRRYVVEKGSIAVDGISLTPYGLDGATFRCAVIRETVERTTLKDRKVGDAVNLEFDVLAKYAERMMRFVYHD